jgi:predicted ATP-grasp superfamily ATP-dependent carboligase
VAAAVHLKTGETFGGVCNNRAVPVHPDSSVSIAQLKIPSWDALLEAAMHLAESLELGYVGVDFVIDANVGPVVLEANARPGLAIQLANRRGLGPRLQLVDAEPEDPIPPERRRELAATLADLP